jgi:ribosomal protein L37AE/L43A
MTEVQENARRLESCTVPHNFTVDITPDRTIFKRWACAKCGGSVDDGAKSWYARGLAHAEQVQRGRAQRTA